MYISIDEKAISWFKREFDSNSSVNIRMFPQYAGFGEKHKGYSLAFSMETPANAGFAKEISGIKFFVEDNDVWFFDDAQTYMTVDEQLNELLVTFKEEGSTILN